MLTFRIFAQVPELKLRELSPKLYALINTNDLSVSVIGMDQLISLQLF